MLFGNTAYVYMFVDMTLTRVEYLERLSRQGLCLDFLVFAVPGIAKGLTKRSHLWWHVSHFSVVGDPSSVLGGGCKVYMRPYPTEAGCEV